MKIIFPIRACPTYKWKFQKYSNKIRKSNKYPYGFISRQNRLEKAAKEWKEKLSFRFVLTRRVIENSKKIAKKFKKLKKTIMASFQSKIHRRPRKRENENYCSNPFLHDPWLKFQKNSNKIGWKRLEKAEKERKKIIYPFVSFLPEA